MSSTGRVLAGQVSKPLSSIEAPSSQGLNRFSVWLSGFRTAADLLEAEGMLKGRIFCETGDAKLL